jgi:Integrase core domain
MLPTTTPTAPTERLVWSRPIHRPIRPSSAGIGTVCTGGTGSAVCSTSTTDKLHERVSAPYGVGTVRRELLDRTLTMGRLHLETVLSEYVMHYHQHRPHRSLDQGPPLGVILLQRPTYRS